MKGVLGVRVLGFGVWGFQGRPKNRWVQGLKGSEASGS